MHAEDLILVTGRFRIATFRTLIELDRDGYAPRKSLFTGVITRFRLPSGMAETLLSDYRAGFPDACLLFPDTAQTLACLRASGNKNIALRF